MVDRGRELLAWIVGGLTGAIVWFVLTIVVTVLVVAKPLILVAFIAALWGCMGATIYFGLHDQWFSAAQYFAGSVAVGILLRLYVRLGEAVDPDFLKPRPVRYYWW